jgi:hypothetical protein
LGKGDLQKQIPPLRCGMTKKKARYTFNGAAGIMKKEAPCERGFSFCIEDASALMADGSDAHGH